MRPFCQHRIVVRNGYRVIACSTGAHRDMLLGPPTEAHWRALLASVLEAARALRRPVPGGRGGPRR